MTSEPSPRRVALFVPCYVDQLYPDVALATLELLEGLGLEVAVPREPMCCGQVLTNAGAMAAARPLAARFEASFGPYEHVVCPSGSCTAALHRHAEWLGQEPWGAASRTVELCQFLVDVLGSEPTFAPFPHRVVLHQSCHALRELGLGSASELSPARGRESPARRLLARVPGLTLVEPARADECCGFGGAFSVREPEVSVRMGEDRMADFEAAGAGVVTSSDMSCLMHLSGVMGRRPLRVMHIAQILAGRALPGAAR